MIYEDKSALADVSMPDGDVLSAFFRGDAAMHSNSVVYFTVTPGSDNAPADLAKKLDKPIEDVVGWMTQPVGTNGRGTGTQGQVDLVGLSPDLDDEALDKAVSLLLHTQRPGWVQARKAVFDDTKDPKRVYDWANIMPRTRAFDRPGAEFAGGCVGQEVHGRGAARRPDPDRAQRGLLLPARAERRTHRDRPGGMTSRWANERGSVRRAGRPGKARHHPQQAGRELHVRHVGRGVRQGRDGLLRRT